MVRRYLWLAAFVVGCVFAIAVILEVTEGASPRSRAFVGIPIALLLGALWQAWEEPRLRRKAAARLKAPTVWNGFAVLVFARGVYAQTLKSRYWSPTMIGGWCYIDDEHVSFVPSLRMQRKGAEVIRIPIEGVASAQVTRKWQLTGRHAHQLTLRTLSGEVALRVLEPAGSFPMWPFTAGVTNG